MAEDICPMTRKVRVARLILLLPVAWMLMQAVHELGHVLAAWATGGVVQRVVIHPLTISRTDVLPNPRPGFVAWAGPLVGVAIPLVAAAYASRSWPGACRWYAHFFAGFCLVANGAYIGAGSLEGVGDADDMLRHGSPRWLLIAVGSASVVAGLYLWHRLGKLARGK